MASLSDLVGFAFCVLLFLRHKTASFSDLVGFALTVPTIFRLLFRPLYDNEG